jgi:hypothetical protein
MPLAPSCSTLAFVQPEKETDMIRSAICAAFSVALISSGAALLVSAQTRPQSQATLAPGDRPIAGVSVENAAPIVAKVAAIDASGETVTLTFADGSTATQKISGSLMKNLGQFKVGDTVIVTYRERKTFIAYEPNARQLPPEKFAAAVMVRDPQLSVGVGAAKKVQNYYVVGTNPAAKTLSVVDVNGGPVRTFTVNDTVAQTDLPLLKPGYRLSVADTEAFVIAIDRQAPQRT